MKWKGRRESDNIEDRRGMPVRGMAVGGGLGSLVLALVLMYFNIDPGPVLQRGPQPAAQPNGQQADPNDPTRKFVGVVLAETEAVWNDLFQREFGRPYREPKLVLFSGQVESACGVAGAAVGPFYCPADQKVYLDLTFFEELRSRFKAPGDFAAAYVVAHEVGHHVQNLLGISDRVHQARGRLDKTAYNEQSVRLELQADFLAGVWAHHMQENRQLLEAGDIREAMEAAKAVGDDRLQSQARGTVAPESFTHGTSAQRAKWFNRGFETGDLSIMEELFERPYGQL